MKEIAQEPRIGLLERTGVPDEVAEPVLSNNPSARFGRDERRFGDGTTEHEGASSGLELGQAWRPQALDARPRAPEAKRAPAFTSNKHLQC